MAIQRSDYIWHNGTMVPWDQVTVHISAHALHYGSSAFEGIRAYNVGGKPAVFRLKEHVRRLFDSCKIYGMDPGYTQEEIVQAGIETVRINQLQSCYVRPLIYRGTGAIGVNPLPCSVETAIMAFEWGKYLGEEAIEQGVDVGVSSWRRMAPGTSPAMAKLGGPYINSQFIRVEANRHGYEEGIALNHYGYVSEGSGENIFIIRDGVIHTPSLASAILPGITRDSVITLAGDMGYTVKEELIPREFLYIADEVFFTGTAAEVSPIRSIDGVQIGAGKRGPITERLQKEFFGIVDGSIPDRHGWLTPVE